MIWANRWPILLSVAFFGLYQAVLAVHPTKFPLYPEWLFGADSMEQVLNGTSETLASTKHPLFVAVSRPLFGLGRAIFQRAPSPLNANLALTFPVALVGAIGVGLSFGMFRRNGPDIGSALYFSLLLGIASAALIFSGFPETYALTALTTIVFLRVVLARPDPDGLVVPAAVANAVACYASPQQIFLSIIPCTYVLIHGRVSLKSIRQAFFYLFLLTVLFVLPYEVYLELSGHGWKLAGGYLLAYMNFENLLQPAWYLVVLLNLFILPVLSPVIHPSVYSDPSLRLFTDAPATWLILAGAFLLLAANSLLRLRKPSVAHRELLPGLAIYLIASTIFIVLFNPSESFLYALPNLPLWLFVLHSGMAGEGFLRNRVFLSLLLAGIGLNNLLFIGYLNGLR